MKAVVTLLVLQIILEFRATAEVFTADVHETFRNLLVSERGRTVVLGTNTSLRRLSSDHLSELQKMSLPEGQVNRLLIEVKDSVLSCAGMRCVLLDISDFTIQSWEDSTVLMVGKKNADGLIFEGREGQLILTLALENEMQPSSIIRGRIEGVSSGIQQFDPIARQSERNSGTPRHFLLVFDNGEFSYFVSRMYSIVKDSFVTGLTRLCNNDTTPNRVFASHFEMELACGDLHTIPTAASYSSLDQTITLSVVRGEIENLVCIFEISEINQLMTEKYDSCRAGVGLSGLSRVNRFGSRCVEFIGDRLTNPVSYLKQSYPCEHEMCTNMAYRQWNRIPCYTFHLSICENGRLCAKSVCCMS